MERRFFVMATGWGSSWPDRELSPKHGFESLEEAEESLARYWSREKDSREYWRIGQIEEMIRFEGGGMETERVFRYGPEDTEIAKAMARLEAKILGGASGSNPDPGGKSRKARL